MARIDEFEVIASFSEDNYMVILMCDVTPQHNPTQWKRVSSRLEFTINSRDIFKGI